MGPLAATTLQEVQARVQLLGRRHVLAQRTGRGQRLRTSVCYQHARPQHSFSSVEGERVREHWHRDRTQTLHGPHFYLLQHIHVEMFMVTDVSEDQCKDSDSNNINHSKNKESPCQSTSLLPDWLFHCHVLSSVSPSCSRLLP